MRNNANVWTRNRLEECIRNYRELYELHRMVSVGSSWMSGTGGSGGLPRVYPGKNPELLFSLWDLERILPHLPVEYEAVFYLRYWSQWTQERVASLMHCSRQHVWYLQETLPQRIMEGLQNRAGWKDQRKSRLRSYRS